MDSIKHWPDQAAGIQECLRVLKPGGVFTILELEKGRSYLKYYSFLRDPNHPSILREFFFPFFISVINSQGIDENAYETIHDQVDGQINDSSIYQAEKTDDYGVPLLVFDGKKS